MVVKDYFNSTVERDDYNMNYFYRMTSGEFNKGQAFGIEIERQDLKDGKLVNIERNSVELISTSEEKVRDLFNLISRNNVSPIHLIDVIGEYVDEYVSDFM